MGLSAGRLCLILFVAISAKRFAPPVITKPTQFKDIYCNRGDEVILQCRAAKGNYSIDYTWLSNENVVTSEISNAKGKFQSIGFDGTTGDLNISSYHTRYDGSYVCIASVDGASRRSPAQRLFERRLGDFKAKDYSSTYGKRNDYMAMPCTDKGLMICPPNEIRYYWYMSDVLKKISMDGGRLFIDTDGNLHFAYLKSKDSTAHPNYYRCGYSMTNSKKTYLGIRFGLNITKQSTPGNVKPVLRYSNTGVTGLLGSSVSLSCFFSGYDIKTTDHIPDTKWFASNDTEIRGQTDKHELSNNNRTLTIKNITAEDETSYYCQGVTTTQSSEKMEVKFDIALGQPMWVEAPRSQNKSEKRSATFDCSARNFDNEKKLNPPLWYINGKKVDASVDFNHFVFAPSKKSLTINNLQKPRDNICVQCVVKNNIGSTLGEACLCVLDPINVTIQPGDIQRITKGDTIQLTVKAYADPDVPDLNYQWSFNDKTYNHATDMQFTQKDDVTNHIFIDTSVLTQEWYETVGGLYTCRVSHPYDSVDVTTEVILLDVHPGDDNDASRPNAVPGTDFINIDDWIIGFGVGIALLVLMILILVCLILRKQTRDNKTDEEETEAGLQP